MSCFGVVRAVVRQMSQGVTQKIRKKVSSEARRQQARFQ